jgi:protein gp37
MQNSSIEWTDHTFNPWWGCQRVSPGCEHCYAETLARRYNFKVWGPAKTTERREMSANYWKQPIKWDKLAQVSGRKRVFCASMADVFEDHPQIVDARARLFNLIDQTPNLDWLLLTKRPENVNSMVPWHGETGLYHGWPVNVWIGTSCEDQERADKRIPELLKVPARVRFLSCEPLLGAIDIRKWVLLPVKDWDNSAAIRAFHAAPSLHWVIAGGESGHAARPMHPDWARGLRDQCQAAGVAYFFKQWGEYGAPQHSTPGGKVSLFCAGGTVRTVEIAKLGKHAAGRLLDGCEWNEMPA